MREEKKSAMGLVCVNVRKLREGERDKVERISVSFGYSEAIAKTMIMTFSLLFLFLYYHFDCHNKNLCVLREVLITFYKTKFVTKITLYE